MFISAYPVARGRAMGLRKSLLRGVAVPLHFSCLGWRRWTSAENCPLFMDLARVQRLADWPWRPAASRAECRPLVDTCRLSVDRWRLPQDWRLPRRADPAIKGRVRRVDARSGRRRRPPTVDGVTRWLSHRGMPSAIPAIAGSMDLGAAAGFHQCSSGACIDGDVFCDGRVPQAPLLG